MVEQPKIRELNLGFLPARFFVCTSQAEFEHTCITVTNDKSPGAWLSDGAEGTTHICDMPNLSKRIVIVCIEEAAKIPPHHMVSVVAHECLHVVQAIEQVMSEEKPGIEYPAYLIGELAKFVWLQYHPEEGN